MFELDLRPRSPDLRCTYCFDGLHELKVWTCSGCATLLHPECAGELQVCPTYGCDHSHDLREAEAPAFDLAEPPSQAALTNSDPGLERRTRRAYFDARRGLNSPPPRVVDPLPAAPSPSANLGDHHSGLTSQAPRVSPTEALRLADVAYYSAISRDASGAELEQAESEYYAARRAADLHTYELNPTALDEAAVAARKLLILFWVLCALGWLSIGINLEALEGGPAWTLVYCIDVIMGLSLNLPIMTWNWWSSGSLMG